MLDMYTSNNKFAFQFEELDDMRQSPEDYGVPENMNLGEINNQGDGLLAVMTPSEQGGWKYQTFISADRLEKALKAAGLIPGE